MRLDDTVDDCLGPVVTGISPIKQGEVRASAAIENKFTASSPSEIVREQLQADMHIMSTGLLECIVKEHPLRALSITLAGLLHLSV